ncbi:MAG: hypothetical protein JWO51_171 [Rhodospirillales bacterium]|nr:hypothetical protein [Rhodospirillales bacterium]
MRLRDIVIAAIGFAGAVILTIHEYSWVPGHRHPAMVIYSFLSEWQTALTGIVAVYAALLTVRATRLAAKEAAEATMLAAADTATATMKAAADTAEATMRAAADTARATMESAFQMIASDEQRAERMRAVEISAQADRRRKFARRLEAILDGIEDDIGVALSKNGFSQGEKNYYGNVFLKQPAPKIADSISSDSECLDPAQHALVMHFIKLFERGNKLPLLAESKFMPFAIEFDAAQLAVRALVKNLLAADL